MKQLHINLRKSVSDEWNNLVTRPDFLGLTNEGVVNKLILAYLNPPIHYTTAAHKAHEAPEERVDAVAARKKRKAEEEQAAQDIY